MADGNPNSNPGVLESLGEEIVRIVAPVSACMLLVVLLVTALHAGGDGGTDVTSIATIAYSEEASDSFWDKLEGALLNSFVFVAVITVLTFLLVLLFYFRCMRFLKSYMAFSSFVVLGLLGGQIFLFLTARFYVPVDVVTFSLLLLNFSVVGVLAVFLSKVPILVNQGYLVTIGVLVAYSFTLLPEWTTWALLVAMSLYDLAAVLLPGGPLRLLVELAISRDEELPALVYEARPVEQNHPGVGRRLWRESRDTTTTNSSSNSNDLEAGNPNPRSQEASLVVAEEDASVSAVTTPLLPPQLARRREEDAEGIGLGSSGAIKLGLGDFIFYSVLVGRAALYDFMTVYACYLAIMAGLGITLLLLAVYRKALPALPVSVALGILFYLLTRYSLEVFMVQCSTNLLMF
ncbi:presenilin-like protein At2g29900 [Curcuma longa]|uniref:presenilin-like protein At2g29900 n=1 Tax=Curcuma longa TaxID=136217 RepID=UPI003D9DBB53